MKAAVVLRKGTPPRRTTPRLVRVRRRFYLQPTLRVAQQLIGKYLVKRIAGRLLIGRIVEVEAYLGERDPASHAYNGRTARNAAMFKQGGHLYVYFTYGMHFCANVVTEEQGIGHAVLLRAVEPIGGFEAMASNRNMTIKSDRVKLNLCNGPAKLCEAFGIGRDENGIDLCGNMMWLAEHRTSSTPKPIVRTTRVGITRGKEHKWRFYLKESPYVSRGKPS